MGPIEVGPQASLRSGADATEFVLSLRRAEAEARVLQAELDQEGQSRLQVLHGSSTRQPGVAKEGEDFGL